MSSLVKTASEKWDDENYSVEIDCPIHLTHKVKLFTYGHKYAGIWECEIEGASETCPHFDTEVEVAERYEGSTEPITICSLCRVEVKT